MIYTKQNWDDLLKAKDSGEKFECDREVFNYFLEVLPPVFMRGSTFGFAEGAEPVTKFWQEGGRFFGKKTKTMNPYAFC